MVINCSSVCVIRYSGCLTNESCSFGALEPFHGWQNLDFCGYTMNSVLMYVLGPGYIGCYLLSICTIYSVIAIHMRSLLEKEKAKFQKAFFRIAMYPVIVLTCTFLHVIWDVQRAIYTNGNNILGVVDYILLTLGGIFNFVVYFYLHSFKGSKSSKSSSAENIGQNIELSTTWRTFLQNWS